jgi:hypothetical protein
MANSNGGIVGVDNPPTELPDVITTFNSSGTLTTAPYTTEIEYLVVAGGGGGGGYAYGGGGGAGGFLTGTGNPVLGGSPYPITVGAGGGAGGNETDGAKGSNSVLGTPSPIISEGGGFGSTSGPYNNAPSGGPGGSGGGKGSTQTGQPNDPSSAGTGVPGQGYPGGSSNVPNSPINSRSAGAGGGGAGAAGADSGTGTIPPNTLPPAGNGGVGLESTITGSPAFYAGGGGGGAYAASIAGTGGNGGGGRGCDAGPSPLGSFPGIQAEAGTANTGGGGGGGCSDFWSSPGEAKAGGSGVVIVKELGAGFVASGIWSMDAVYDNVKVGNWTNA